MTSFLIGYPSIPFIFVLVIAMVIRWFRMPQDQKRTEWMLVVAALAIPVSALSVRTAKALTLLRPMKYDQFIYAIDSLFGNPSFILGRILVRYQCVDIVACVIYEMITAMIPLTIGVYIWKRSESETTPVLKAFLLNFVLAVPIYLIIPVCGPAFAFPEFPFTKPVSLIPHAIPIAAAPNGIPSVHMATALLICWYLRYWLWGRVVGVLYVALTIVATLGSGQHYLFDLICAVPYAMTVHRLSLLGQSHLFRDAKIAAALRIYPSHLILPDAPLVKQQLNDEESNLEIELNHFSKR